MVRRVRRFRWDNDVLLRVILIGLVWGMEDGLFAWHYYMQAHAWALTTRTGQSIYCLRNRSILSIACDHQSTYFLSAFPRVDIARFKKRKMIK